MNLLTVRPHRRGRPRSRWSHRAFLFIGRTAAGLAAIGLSLGMAHLFRLGVQHRAYDEVLYAVVAQRVTAGATTDAERVDRLVRYVFQNVHTPQDTLLDDDRPPAETLLGGYGFCDQQVRLFMALAHKVGLTTREVFLLDTVRGTSPHTVAEVWEASRWAFVDVYYDYIPTRTDGSPATLDDLVARSDPIIRLSGLSPSVYKNVRVQLDTPANPLAALLWQHVPGQLAQWAQDVYLRLTPRTIPVPGGWSTLTEPDQRLYWQARNHRLFGRNQVAVAEYRSLLQRYPQSRYANDARFDLALLVETAAPHRALHVLGRLQTHEPSPPVREEAFLLAGQISAALATPQACRQAFDFFDRVAAGMSVSSPAAVFSLQQAPCSAAAQPTLATFGALQLVSAQLTSQSVSLLWRVANPMDRDYTVFVHALDEQGHIVAQDDSQPDRGVLPTSTLHGNDLVPDDHPLVLPPSAVQVELGVYYLPNSERLTRASGSDTYVMPVPSSDTTLGHDRLAIRGYQLTDGVTYLKSDRRFGTTCANVGRHPPLPLTHDSLTQSSSRFKVRCL